MRNIQMISMLDELKAAEDVATPPANDATETFRAHIEHLCTPHNNSEYNRTLIAKRCAVSYSNLPKLVPVVNPIEGAVEVQLLQGVDTRIREEFEFVIDDIVADISAKNNTGFVITSIVVAKDTGCITIVYNTNTETVNEGSDEKYDYSSGAGDKKLDQRAANEIGEKYGIKAAGHTKTRFADLDKEEAEFDKVNKAYKRKKAAAKRKRDKKKAATRAKQKAAAIKTATLAKNKAEGIKHDADVKLDEAKKKVSDKTKETKDKVNDKAKEVKEKVSKKSISETVYPDHVITLDSAVKFDFPMQEALTIVDDGKLYPMYVILTYTGSILAKAITGIFHDQWTHCSVSFDSSLRTMYSFVGKLKPGYKGGFTVEDIKRDLPNDREIPYAVYMTPMTLTQINLMKAKIAYFKKNKSKFSYDAGGLGLLAIGVENEPQTKWFCSRFCADILNAGLPDEVLIKTPSLCRPQAFAELPFAHMVDTGDDLHKYTSRKVDANTKKLIRVFEINTREALPMAVGESAIALESVYDCDIDNPYALDIFSYKAATLDENAFADFIDHLKSFKLRFSKNGDIILTKRECGELCAHFNNSQKLMNAYKKSGNIQGMKDELYKTHYIIDMINTHYLSPSATKKYKDRAIYKDMIDLRAVMLSYYQQNMAHVMEKDPNWNFQEGYNKSKYTQDVNIPRRVVSDVTNTILTTLSV